MRSLIRIIFIIFIVTGFSLICNEEIIKNKKIKENDEAVINIKKDLIKNLNDNNKKYKGIIEIPKINLKRVFYDRESKENSIDKNIMLLSFINGLELENNTIIFASHSGNSHVSYFRNLYKLNKNDVIYIFFGKYKYEYRVYKYYEEDKDGDIFIKDNDNYSNLVLTTCKPLKKQLVYIAFLKEKERL